MLDLFAACLPGLEPLLADELRALGAASEQRAGGSAFRGPVELLLRAHLHLGSASHLLVRCGSFRCLHLGELVAKTAQLPWRDWLRPGIPFAVRAAARHSKLHHTGAIEERVHKGIAKVLDGAVQPTDGAAAVQVAVRFVDDVATLSIDTSATPLHRRGYRLDGSKAPLREDLAFALLHAGGFARGHALLDPFCGSGTIAIEAAAITAALPPGRLRPPPLRGLLLQDDAAWRNLLATLPATADAAVADSRIAASDRDAGAVDAARANAMRAGVAASLDLQCCAFTAAPWLAEPEGAPSPLLLASNPPFGRRLGKGKDLANLYQALGHRAGKIVGLRTALLAHDLRLARRIGLPLRVAFATRHGGLRIAALVGGF